MTASIDGTSKSFNIAVVATRQSTGNTTVVDIVGVLSPITGESMNLTITNSNNTPIKAGVYTDTTAGFDLEAIYTANASIIYNAGNAVNAAAKVSGATIANHFKLVITSIDSASVSGTFSGDFYLASIVPGTTKSVTSGDFSAQFK
jgi:hypothetical protein